MKYTIEVADEDNWIEQIVEVFNTDKTIKLEVFLIPKYLMGFSGGSDNKKEHELGLIRSAETLLKTCNDSGNQHKISIEIEYDSEMFFSENRYSITLVFVKSETRNEIVVYENYQFIEGE